MPDEGIGGEDTPVKKPQYDAETLAKLAAARKAARADMRKLTEPIRESARLTASDYAIRINAKS